MLAAHDAGEPERLLLVADEEQVGLEIEHLAVQQRERLAGAREAHDDGAVEQAVVVRVQRLSLLEHHVVGDVDDRRNRADAAALEALLHPRGRGRLGVDPLDRARDEARAAGRVLDAHLASRVRLATGGAAISGSASGAAVAAATSRARPTSDRQSARFGVSLSVIDRVVERERLPQVGADGRVGWQRK